MVRSILKNLALKFIIRRMQQTSNEFNPVIIVMAKVPRPGEVKTRLRPFLTDEQCASLAICFLKDTAANAAKISPNVIVAFSPPEQRTEIETLLPAKTVFVEQYGGNLGERLKSAIESAENLGYSPIITIGTDSPTLPLKTLQSAVESFRESEIGAVLGATKDGGYYLIGLRKSIPEIFEDVSWSSESVYRETLEKAKSVGIENLVELPVWYDVDVPADLIFLRNEVFADETLPRRVPETYRWLLAHRDLFI